MALVLGTNSGFVTTAPTADPAGSNVTIDGSSVVTKHTTPAGARKIVEIGWYRGSGTNAINFEIALYADGAGVATTRLFVDDTNSSSVGGWIITTVNWDVSPSTPYWLGLQMDAHGGSSSVDSATSGGAGIDILTAQTTLNDPYGGGLPSDVDGMYAIYALVRSVKNFSDTLALTSLTSDPILTLGTIYNFSDTLALTSLTSAPKLNREIAFSDILALDSLTSTPDLSRQIDYADSLALTSLTSQPVLFRLIGFSDALDLSSLTSAPVLTTSTIKNFSDVLALTSLTSEPKLFRQVDVSDTLNLTSLVSTPSLFREVTFSDTLALSSLTSDPVLSLGTIYNFSDSLALTSLTSTPVLSRSNDFGDTLALTSLTSAPTLSISGILNFSDTLNLTSLTSTPVLSLNTQMFRWTGTEWELLGNINI